MFDASEAGCSTISGCFPVSHGIWVVTVNAASAMTPSVAMAQRIRIKLWLLLPDVT